MRVLLTNDDGIFAKGIETLHLALRDRHEVTVVAPETEQSAVGHAITFLDPLRVKAVSRNGVFFGWAVNGTPADCVKLAVRELMHPGPEVVVSGINLGANVGVNVIYSGTVSAATEGAMMGLPSLAVSLEYAEDPDFSPAARVGRHMLALIEARGLPRGISLNVNVPHLPEARIKGVRVTRQGRSMPLETYERRIDPRNRAYYWLRGAFQTPETHADSDVLALSEGYVSVTPLRYDLTDDGALSGLSGWGLGEWGAGPGKGFGPA